MLGGSVISWKSTLQDMIVLSSTEAKYMVTIEATKEAIWLNNLVGEQSF